MQLGKLYWSVGRIADAAAQYREALRVFPGYAYALDALAQVEARAGRLPRARSRSSGRPSTRIPLPQYVATLGDLYRVDRPAGAGAHGSTR